MITSELTLRPATPADAEAVAALFTASRSLLDFLPLLHTAEEDRGFIRDVVLANAVVTVAEDGNGIAGFIAETPGWIEHLYVAPDRLGAGVGSSLLAVAMSRQEAIELWCFAGNSRGRAFYEKHGFRPVEHTDGSGNEARMPDIRYRWGR